MTTWWGNRHTSGEMLTLDGAVLIHDNAAEIEWLIPGFPAVPLPGATPEDVARCMGRPVMRWRDHPDMAAVRWPVMKEDFL